MTDQAKDLIKAAHNLLGKTNTGDFDNIAQCDAVIKAMQLLSSVLEDIFDADYYDFENHETVNVDAWMPLPKACKAEMEGEE